MFNRLSEIIKKLEGNVLTIGLDDILLSCFKNNNSVNIYTIYSSKTNDIFSNQKKKKTKKVYK